MITAIETRLKEPSGGPIFTNRIVRAKAQFLFTRELQARAIVQWDDLSAARERTFLTPHRTVNVDVLLTWLLHPGTAVYAGFNDNRADLDGRFSGAVAGLLRPGGVLTSDGRQFFIKASYLWRR